MRGAFIGAFFSPPVRYRIGASLSLSDTVIYIVIAASWHTPRVKSNNAQLQEREREKCVYIALRGLGADWAGGGGGT